jgi:hypothetical protein
MSAQKSGSHPTARQRGYCRERSTSPGAITKIIVGGEIDAVRDTQLSMASRRAELIKD